MAKLTEILSNAVRNTGSSLGFIGSGSASRKPKARAIIAPYATGSRATDLANAGVDIAVITPGTDTSDLKAAKLAWGVDVRQSPDVTEETLQKLHEDGALFVLLGFNTSARLIGVKVEKLEKVIFLDPPKDDPLYMQFKTTNTLAVDAAALNLDLAADALAKTTIREMSYITGLIAMLQFQTIVTLKNAPDKADAAWLVKTGARGFWLQSSNIAEIEALRVALESVPHEPESGLLS